MGEIQRSSIWSYGSSFTPGIVIPRKTIETELYDCGYTREKVNIMYQENGFFDTDCFLSWADEEFFPEIDAKREMFEYSGEALFIMDGFGPHENDYFLDECCYRGIIVLPLPPHSSDQCQPLDIGLFHVQKRKMQRMVVDSCLSNQTIQLIKILDSFKQAAIPSNIVSAFRAADICSKYDKEKNVLIPFVDRGCAIKVIHWHHSKEIEFDKTKIPVDDECDVQFPSPSKKYKKKKLSQVVVKMIQNH